MQKYKIESYGNLNGYITVCVPSYPRPTSSNYAGWQYEHIFLKELEIGRFLNPDECVHHLDGNRANNHPSNLILMTKRDHVRLHAWINMGKIHEPISEKTFRCIVCNEIVPEKKSKHCSKICASKTHAERMANKERNTKNVTSKSKLTLDKQTLIDLLTKHKNFSTVGKLCGISDNAIRKWCKKFGISSSSSYWRSLNKPIYTPPKLHRLTSDEITQVKEYFSLPKTDRPYSVRELAKMLDVHHTTLYDIGTKPISPTPTNIT